MPQITLSTNIDADFLAGLANLKQSWGTTVVSPTEQIFAFMTGAIDAVDQAVKDYPAAYLTHRKNLKMEELAAKRRVEELKGPMGLVLDDKTVLRLSVKCYDLRNHPTKTGVRWEVSRGNFAWLDRNTILNLGDLSIQRVEDCFENVYNITEAIKAIELDSEIEDKFVALENALDSLEAIDINLGWPT